MPWLEPLGRQIGTVTRMRRRDDSAQYTRCGDAGATESIADRELEKRSRGRVEVAIS
jgi:hypothetical protein